LLPIELRHRFIAARVGHREVRVRLGPTIGAPRFDRRARKSTPWRGLASARTIVSSVVARRSIEDFATHPETLAADISLHGREKLPLSCGAFRAEAAPAASPIFGASEPPIGR
jgi:hypothetical protein